MSLEPPSDSDKISSPSPPSDSSIPASTNADTTATLANGSSSSDGELGDEAKTVEITLESIDKYPSYVKYVSNLAEKRFPSLNIVLDFLNSTPGKTRQGASYCSESGKGCVVCTYFRLHVLALHRDSTYTKVSCFEAHTEAPADRLVEDMVRKMSELTHKNVENKVERYVLLVEDIKPRGMKFLGTYFNVDPRIFERLLNYKREFTSALANVHVLDYNQGYIYCDVNGGKVLRNFQDEMLHSARIVGKLRRLWRDIVGHEQRIVFASLSETDLIQSPTDIILFNGLPEESDLQFKSKNPKGLPEPFKLRSFESLKAFPSFFRYREDFNSVTQDLGRNSWSNLTAIALAVIATIENGTIPVEQKAISGAVSFVSEKWTSIIDQIQEAISETDIPEASGLLVLRTIMQRKHLYSELKRTLDTLCEGLTVQELNGAREELNDTSKKIGNWVTELESTLSLSMAYLSLDDTQRQMNSATRANQITLLAFVFIPLSTISSIFGMNVNVLQHNPPIYWFAVTAAVVSVLTFAYAMYFRYINHGFAATTSWLLSLLVDINHGFVAAAFWLLSLLLDITFFSGKVIVVPFWCLAWILGFFCIGVYLMVILVYAPIVLLVRCLFLKEAREKHIRKFSDAIVEPLFFIWLSSPWGWNGLLAIFEWAPSRLDMRLEWRGWKRAPNAPHIDLDRNSGGADGADCVVM